MFTKDREILNTGNVYDNAIQGGHLGVFAFDQHMVSWSNLIARCIDHENEAFSFDGVDDYVKLASVKDYSISGRLEHSLFLLISTQ